MQMTLFVVVAAWGLLTVLGWILLAPLCKPQRDALLPAAPLFGVVLLVVVLHDTTLLLSVHAGVLLLVPVLVLLLGVAFRRDRRWWQPTRRSLAALALTAACGVVPAFWALGPSLAVGDSNVVQMNDNNDAFYYVTTAAWLQDHPATDVPEIAASPAGPGVPPSYGPARAQLNQNLRIGQELTHAALSTVMGAGVERTWYPLTALWILLLPASGVAAARFLRLHLASGLALGLVVSVSAIAFFQLASQNSDSLLGAALLFPALGAVVRAVGQEPLAPWWLSAMTLTALVGTYTEYVTLIGLAMVVAVLVRRPSQLLSSIGTALLVLGTAVVIAPLVWLRAVRSLLFLGGIPSDNYPTAFGNAPIQVIVARFLGVVSVNDTAVPRVLLGAVVAFLLVGLVAALAVSRRRWWYAALVVPGLSLAVYLVTARDRPYTQQRVVQLLLPLLLLVVAAGWDHLWRAASAERSARGGRRAARSTAGVRGAAATVLCLALLGTLLTGISNARVVQGMDLEDRARLRHVGPQYAQAAGWLHEVGGEHGDDSMVLVGDFFSQLWITDALRDLQDVAYPSLFVSYQYQNAYWDGTPRRWLLVDNQTVRDTSPGVVVRHNSLFSLLDLSRGRAVVAAHADEFGQNSWVVLRSPTTPSAVKLIGPVRARVPQDIQPLPGYGEVLDPVDVAPGRATVRLELGTATALRVVLSDQDELMDLTSLKFKRAAPRTADSPG